MTTTTADDDECICGHPGLTYDGPDVDCPVHGDEDAAQLAHMREDCPWYQTRGLPDAQRKPCGFGCWSEPKCEVG